MEGRVLSFRFVGGGSVGKLVLRTVRQKISGCVVSAMGRPNLHSFFKVFVCGRCKGGFLNG